ncbi:MAG: hypothetical protein K1X57_22545, partial [Gemmataceae bacterium]|nr:hypothetical protein [Gemmataceae bacterium]
LSVLVNDPDSPGTFINTAAVTGANYYSDVVVGDFNQDGLPDVATTSRNLLKELHLFMNNPAMPGALLTPFRSSFITGPLLAASDFNADGLLDFVNSTADFLINGPPGVFSESSGVAMNPLLLNAADLDMDGLADLVGIDFDRTSIFVGLHRTSKTVEASHPLDGVRTDFGVRRESDRDGIRNAIEDLAPHAGDGNNDGIRDSQQFHVASLPNPFDGEYVTLVSPPGTQLLDVRVIPSPSPADAPVGVAFSAGFFEFTVEGVAPGGQTTVELILHSHRTVNTYYKYGPTPDDPAPHWYQFLFSQASCDVGIDCTGAEFVNGRVILHLQDGGRGDDDPASARIHDPGGPAFGSRSPPSSPRIFGSDTIMLGQDLSTLLKFTTYDDEVYAADIRWGDGSTESFPVDRDGVRAWVSTGHRFRDPGSYEVQATLRGSGGFRDSATHTVQVMALPEAFAAAQLVPNAAHPGTSTLVVGGSDQDDLLHLSLEPSGRSIRATLNDTLFGTFPVDAISLVVVLGNLGNDRLEVDPGISREVVLVGGEGDDVLLALPGNASILGGQGKDRFQLTASDITLNLKQSATSPLATLETIDIAGGHRNTVIIGAETVSAVSGSAGPLIVLANDDDVVQFDDGFSVENPIFQDTAFFHVVSRNDAKILLGGLRPWQNPVRRHDANLDNSVTPIDALVIINELNLRQSHQLPVPPVPDLAPPKYYDTTGDNFISPLDVLAVVNYLNRHVLAEGESTGRTFSERALLDGRLVFAPEHASLVSSTTGGVVRDLVATQGVQAKYRLLSGALAAALSDENFRYRAPLLRRAAPVLQEVPVAAKHAFWQDSIDWTLDLLGDLIHSLGN